MSAPLFEQNAKTPREWLLSADNVNQLCNLMNWIYTMYLNSPWKHEIPVPNVWKAIGMKSSELPRWGECPVDDPGGDIFSWGPHLGQPWLMVAELNQSRCWNLTRRTDYIVRRQWLAAQRKNQNAN